MQAKMDKETSLIDANSHIGYITAELYATFARWVAQKAVYPVKIALRDGEPIDMAAQFLHKEGIIDASDWSAVHLNAVNSVKYAYYAEDYPMNAKYLKQEGIDKDFTFVDVGVMGEIPAKLSKVGHNDIQTLFLNGRLLSNAPDPKETFVPNNWRTLLEFLPKKYQRLNGENADFAEVDGTVVPVLRPNKTLEQMCNMSFCDGLAAGLNDCLHIEALQPEYVEIFQQVVHKEKSVERARDEIEAIYKE